MLTSHVRSHAYLHTHPMPTHVPCPMSRCPCPDAHVEVIPVTLAPPLTGALKQNAFSQNTCDLVALGFLHTRVSPRDDRGLF